MQKPPRIHIEKTLEEIFRDTGKSLPVIINDHCHPGDRDDNLWITGDDYKPPETQIEWEKTCFLDKSYHGYYCCPKIIKYSMNRRECYTQNNMLEPEIETKRGIGVRNRGGVKLYPRHFPDLKFC